MTTETEDTDDHAFLGGRLSLRQFKDGHRAGTDACLLAAALDVRAGERVIDVGAGVGAAGLAVLDRAPQATVALLENDSPSCALARHNILANRMADRACVVEVNLFDQARTQAAGLHASADVVVSNPPFYEIGTLRPSPTPRRKRAHVLDGGSHADWFRAMTRLAAPHGRVAIIHRPDVLPALLSALPTGWGELRLRPILTHPHREATRILLGATRGSRAGMMILPSLLLHQASGSFTIEADALHRGLGSCLLSKKPAVSRLLGLHETVMDQ